MQYKNSLPNATDPAFAKNIVLQTLLPLGFEIVSNASSALSVSGPGYRSTRQSPLLGISYANFDFGESQISVDADLGGIDRKARILLAVLISVGVLDSGIFLALWFFIDRLREATWFLFIPALTLLPWIFLAPWITRFLRRRAEDAIDTLLRNAGGNIS